VEDPAIVSKPVTLSSDEVYFSPPLPGQQKIAEQAIVDEIDKKHTSTLVQAYSFTSIPIAQALIAAHKRGVRVEVLLDRINNSVRNPVPQLIATGGISVFIDASHTIAHNKIVIFDEETPSNMTVINGSYNFTASAKLVNAENIRIRRADPQGPLFAKNWHFHRDEAKTRQYVPHP
jgi:phosphatidylserine/phosphatidylglycerophosphate/cardiolipin synthase-like enzyme